MRIPLGVSMCLQVTLLWDIRLNPPKICLGKIRIPVVVESRLKAHLPK